MPSSTSAMRDNSKVIWSVPLDILDYFRIADNQGIECLREVPGSYDSPSGELGDTLTIDNR
jgi:hypothetical protein